MVELVFQKHFRAVRDLPFCYRCGKAFVKGDVTDYDHVPAKATFNAPDREPPLKLKVHKDTCHATLSVDDKKLGQLIALRRGEGPRSRRDQALRFQQFDDAVAVMNLNIDAGVWRWIQGFHAALYRQPLMTTQYTIRTPFPRADLQLGHYRRQPLFKQHEIFVETLKYNRTIRNLDRVVSNNGKLRYECVWAIADNQKDWMCIFGLDIYDWKDLGSHSVEVPSRGCAGSFLLPDRSKPENASADVPQRRIQIPNRDKLDPFGS